MNLDLNSFILDIRVCVRAAKEFEDEGIFKSLTKLLIEILVIKNFGRIKSIIKFKEAIIKKLYKQRSL